jgi:hypothetical protein
MGMHGHIYDPPSSANPGLLMFLVDKSLYHQHSNLMPILRSQITAICQRFRDANKRELFRLIICEFANASQSRNHVPRKEVSYEVIFGRPIRKLDKVEIYEGINESTYKFDRFVEQFNETHGDSLFMDTTHVGGTNLKAALSQALNEVEYHLESVVASSKNKPPISILMFSGNKHEVAQDYSPLPGLMGMRPNDLHSLHVDEFARKLLSYENVLFGAFNMHGSDVLGQELTVATCFSERMIEAALSGEERYAVPANQRLTSIFNDPRKELIGRPFIFGQEDIQSKPKFLAALIRLGTSTIIESSQLPEDSDEDWEDEPGEDW